MTKIPIAFVDDHKGLRQSLSTQINQFGNYLVTIQADNGRHFIEQLSTDTLPFIVLLDIRMKVMDGYETAEWLNKNHPSIKIIILSHIDEIFALQRMVALGACAFLTKEEDLQIIKSALDSVHQSGFYFGGILEKQVRRAILPSRHYTEEPLHTMSERQLHFLQLCPTGKCYKQIAGEMKLTTFQVDHIREELCDKLGVRTRQELTVFAIQNALMDFTPPLTMQ